MDSTHIPLNDEQIALILADLADQSLIEHVHTCPHCQAQIHSEQQFDSLLHTRLNGLDCPAVEQLTTYFLEPETLSEADQHMLQSHLTICKRCQKELQQLKEFWGDDSLPASRTDETQPFLLQSIHSQSIHILQPRVVSSPTLRGNIKTFNATYQDTTVTLTITAEFGIQHCSLDGEISTEQLDSWTNGLVHITNQQAFTRIVTIDQFGVFHMADVPRTLFAVQLISTDGNSLLLRDIDPR